MEVLEHVDDAGAVVAEAGRVLRPGGVFVYAGPNRTLINRIGLVFVAQDVLGVVPRGTHRWDRLLRPADMERHMRASGIDPGETLGVGLRVRGLPRAALAVIGLLTGRLSYPDAARRIELVGGGGKTVAYQGFGVRR
jgi:2-polyprenyl-6-hydroxyphenyl methylase/3-demethylubiquinone-9 3-methyltransferase